MGYNVTAEDIDRAAEEKGFDFKDPSMLDIALHRAGKFAQKHINEPLESTLVPFAGGVASGPLQLGVNVLNAPGAALEAATGMQTPKASLPTWLDPRNISNAPDTSIKRGSEMAGELVGDLFTGGAAYKGLGKALGMTAKTPLLGRGAIGAATGAALSDSEQLGGRGLGAVLGGILPLVSGVTAGTLGQKGAEIAKEHVGKYNKLYEKILSEGEKAGTSKHLKAPEMLRKMTEDAEVFLKHSGSKYNSSVKRLMNNPSLDNFHDAQSDVGKFIRHVDQLHLENKPVSSSVNRAYDVAKNLQKRIRGALSQGFEKAGKKELIPEYQGTTKGFAKEVVPYKTKEMKAYIGGHGKATEAGKSLLRQKDLNKANLSEQLPGYAIRKAFEDIPAWQKVAIASTLGPAALLALYPSAAPMIKKLTGRGHD